MAYYPLKKVFHMSANNAEQALDEAWEQRRNSPAAVSWPYYVGEFETFAVNTAEVVGLQNAVWSNEIAVTKLWQHLPVAARQHYTHSLLIDEIRSTNEIEGIHSTRQEVSAVLEAAAGSATNPAVSSAAKQFQEMAAAYLGLFAPTALGEKTQFPRTLAHMRALYDQVLLSSLEPDDAPDGQYFRTRPVFIDDGSRRIHSGVLGEESINRRMRTMLDAQGEDRPWSSPV